MVPEKERAIGGGGETRHWQFLGNLPLDKQKFMAACREGGERIAAVLRIMDRDMGPALYRDCRIAVKNDHAALDIVQETFIKVWQRCATFRGDADLLHWIKGILRRTIIDFFRSRRPEQPLDNEEGEMTAEVEAQLAALSAERVATPETILQRHELEICYRRCFARFEAAHPIHAAVMRWVVEDGLTNQDVEALLERSPGATREFISQCRKKARIYLAEWYAMLSDRAMFPDEAANETL